MTDAILFSAKPSMVVMDDAIRHLQDHDKLYWSAPFPIDRAQFTFPMFGFIHISGGQVEYRATIADILPFDPAHYEDPRVKPEEWRDSWKQGSEGHWKTTLVMTSIEPFFFRHEEV